VVVIARGTAIAGRVDIHFVGKDMNLRILHMLVAAAFLTVQGAFAADEPSSRAAETRPDSTQRTSPNPYTDFNKRVQEKLRELGFYTGPVNGDIGPNTQAALAQFQLSVPIPASGQLDELTVAALGVERDATTPGGVSQDSAAGAMPAQQPADKSGANASAGSSQGPALRGTCDALVGPEKDRCLQRGGTIETSAKSSSGATAPSDSK
jgi:hypothetical protein